MATVNPQTFFRFAADHHEMLVELYHHRDGISEAELLQLIRKFSVETNPSASYLVNRLRELGFIDYAPQATAQYEMTRPFAELMSSLLREYRLTSVEVIRSYFTVMDNMAGEMAQATKDKKGDLMVRSLNDASEHIERMRNDSRRNRDEVINTAMRVKSNCDRMSPLRRYEIINHIWTRNIAPLRDMIDTQKAMDASLDRMEHSLEAAEECFQIDGAVAPAISMGRARVRRLRRDVVTDFRESINEITPLYEELRRENALVRGASYALEVIAKKGISSMALPERMGICNWQQKGLFSDSALESYFVTLSGYVPTRPQALRECTVTSTREHIRLEEFDAVVMRTLPINDAIAWLSHAYADVPLCTLLKLYGRMHSGRYAKISFGEGTKKYPVFDAILTACPLRLEISENSITK